MRAVGLAAGLCLGLVFPAIGADPTPPPMEIGELAHWAGPYVGLTLGAAGMGANVDGENFLRDFNVVDEVLSAGLVLGYTLVAFEDNSHPGGWLFGVETDLAGLVASGETDDAKAEMDAEWVGSARLRTGYAWSATYIYGTAGLAFSDVTIKEAGSDANDAFRVGLAAGLGAEFALTERWSARVEGLGYGFRANSKDLESTDADLGFVTFRTGLTRRF